MDRGNGLNSGEQYYVVKTKLWIFDIPLIHTMQELNKLDSYKQTKTDPKELIEFYKPRFLVIHLYGIMDYGNCDSPHPHQKKKKNVYIN